MYYKPIKSFVLDSKKRNALITFLNGQKRMIKVNSIDEGQDCDGNKYTTLWYWPTGDYKTSKKEESVICYAK